jgi:2-methylcitrate dehydratase PrpD
MALATDALVDLVRSTDTLPTSVTERAKRAVRDHLGVASYGTTVETATVLNRYAEGHPSMGVDADAPGVTRALDGTTTTPERAALLNGTYGHAIDYDDTFASIPLHPTTVVTPAALAAGEAVDASGRAFLRAYAIGVETCFRVGHAVFPRQYERGFHTTATVGPLGAVAAAGALYDLDDDGLARAFGIAASSAGGLRRNFGTTTKPLHAGFAASAGLRAVALARAGATADTAVLDDEAGYLATMAGDAADPAAVTDAEGLTGVSDLALKLYPSAHITHGAMEALTRLRDREGLTPERVARVEATLHPGGKAVLVHDDPTDALEAKFSLGFCLASVLQGEAGLSAFTNASVTDPATREVMDRVSVTYDEAAVSELGRYGGVVEVETTDGRTYEATADAPGGPRNPASGTRLREKFDACVAPAAVDGDRLAGAVTDLDTGTVAGVLDAMTAHPSDGTSG